MFDFIRKFFNPAENPAEKVKSSENTDLEVLLTELQPKIEATATSCIGITTTEVEQLDLQRSKFGGYPYFPADQTYPTAKNGKPMRLLAQFNFAEMPNLEPWPTKGLLQFYIAGDDDLFGINFDDPADQSNWRVLYFEELDFEPIAEPERLFEEAWEMSPLEKAPLALDFELRQDYPSYPAMEYDQKILPLFEGKHEELLEERYLDQELGNGHKLGGYPYFTQNEIRETHHSYEAYQLLFQMDSEGDKILWGDVGVANFFITPEALQKRDFSKMLYNWDCH